MQATRARTLTPVSTATGGARHLSVAHCSGDCAQGRKPCACPTGAAEAATSIGFENESAPRPQRRWQPIKAATAWYLKQLLHSLLAQHRRVDGKLTSTANVVIDMARRNQVCPWWPAMRRDLQQRRATLEARIAEVTADLAGLERRA